MRKTRQRHKPVTSRLLALSGIAILLIVSSVIAYAQLNTSSNSLSSGALPPPPFYPGVPAPANPADSIMMPFPVQQTVPANYENLMEDQFAADLATPSNLRTTAEFDPETGYYVVRTKLGETDITTPFLLSEKQYNNWQLRRSLQEYYQQRNQELSENKQKEPFNIFDMNFAYGPLEKIFGPGGVSLKTQGSVQIRMGIKSNKTDNPSLALNSRRKTFFDFEQKIQATIGASVGDRLKFNMTYNTDATFDFDSKNIKLAYEGKEDDIVKSIEAGNVSMTTGHPSSAVPRHFSV